jgi:hypothetical protein
VLKLVRERRKLRRELMSAEREAEAIRSLPQENAG